MARSAIADQPFALCWEDFIAEQSISSLIHEARRLIRCPGGGCTHFIELGESATCALESLAIAVVQWHAKRLGGNAQVGAEWWVQVRDPVEPLSVHWDCDEALKSEKGLHVSPALATVTYLSDVGAPTVVFPVAADSYGCAIAPSAPPLAAFASFPLRAKHLAFDGRLLHGAPYDGPSVPESESVDVASASDNALRVTILVNLWRGRRPLHIERLPAKLAAAIASTGELNVCRYDEDEGDEAASSLQPSSPPSPIAVGACARAVPPHVVSRTSREDILAPRWRAFPIGSFHHPPVCLYPLDDLWTRPSATAHFLRYDAVQVLPPTTCKDTCEDRCEDEQRVGTDVDEMLIRSSAVDGTKWEWR